MCYLFEKYENHVGYILFISIDSLKEMYNLFEWLESNILLYFNNIS